MMRSAFLAALRFHTITQRCFRGFPSLADTAESARRESWSPEQEPHEERVLAGLQKRVLAECKYQHMRKISKCRAQAIIEKIQ